MKFKFGDVVKISDKTGFFSEANGIVMDFFIQSWSEKFLNREPAYWVLLLSPTKTDQYTECKESELTKA